MKDLLFGYNGSSCRCPYCSSLNVYYVLQYPILIEVSPSNKLLKVGHTCNSQTVRTATERAIIFSSKVMSTECKVAFLVCRDCGKQKQVAPETSEEEEV